MPTESPSTDAENERAGSDPVSKQKDGKNAGKGDGKAPEKADEAPSNRRMIHGTNNGQPDALDPGKNGDAYNP